MSVNSRTTNGVANNNHISTTIAVYRSIIFFFLTLSDLTDTTYSTVLPPTTKSPSFFALFRFLFFFMGTAETRSKKKVQLWKKAIFHFILCFVMGFFTGFAPMGKPSFFSALRRTTKNISLQTTQPVEVPKPGISSDGSLETVAKGSGEEMEQLKLLEDQEKSNNAEEENNDVLPRTSLIVVTPTSSGNMFKEVWLRRLANTLKLVPQPLLWIMVEGQYESNIEVIDILRKSGIMYRFLVSKQNFTDPIAEAEYKRNIALRHIEHHRLGGIVHFAEETNVYDLEFFAELRDIGYVVFLPTKCTSSS